MIKNIAVSATAIAIAVVVGTSLAPVAKGKKIRVNTKDLPEHGVKLISPSDSGYDGELNREKEGKDPATVSAFDAVGPFSAFLSNESGRALVAYTLKWEITLDDGSTITRVASVSDGDALSGVDTKSSEAGPTVKVGSKRFVALVPPTSQAGGIRTSPNLQRLGNSPNFGSSGSATMLEKLTAELQHATDLTVSVDNVVFEDGQAVGPDSSHRFEQLRSSLNARNDLLRGALSAIRQGKTLEDVMSRIKEISESKVDLGSGRPTDIYRFYRKEFAAEIVRIRSAVGDDKAALSYALQPLTKKWPILRKE